MKKIAFVLTILSVFLYTACRKDANNKMVSQKTMTGSDIYSAARLVSGNPATRCYDEVIDSCIPPAISCMEDVVVTPSLGSYKASLDAAIASGPTAIGTFFSNEDNWVIFPEPSTEQMNLLASGEYNIIKVVSGGETYYLCGPSGSLTESTAEFVQPLVSQ